MHLPEAIESFSEEGKKLVDSGAVDEVVFSEGTYQVEVHDKDTYWPFLQFDHQKHLVDYFCSCSFSEEHGACPHLAAAFHFIYQKEPLHIRFKHSFFNAVFQMVSRRLGYHTNTLSKKEGVYFSESKDKKKLFELRGLTPKGKKRLNEYIDKRVKETEETSLKFSNLSMEEMQEYREGRAPRQLRYELSFWSDVAKWLFCLQEKEKCSVKFEESDSLPTYCKVQFSDVECSFYISKASWPLFLETLDTVESNLKLHSRDVSTVAGISYDEKNKRFIIEKRDKVVQTPTDKKIDVGEWAFFPKDGFYPKREELFASGTSVESDQIAEFLKTKDISSYLKNAVIHEDPVSYKYTLSMEKRGLHIEAYLFEAGDLSLPQSGIFLPWVYIPKKGFFLTENAQFEEVDRWIKIEEVSEFISKHRLWLHKFPGFQTHFGSFEAHLKYHFERDGSLAFTSELSLDDSLENMIDLGEWIYFKGQGFYVKKGGKDIFTLRPGLTVLKEEISDFITRFHDELMSVEGFFSAQCPVEKIGLSISLGEEEKISLTKETKYAEGIKESNVEFFGDYSYLEGKGFFELSAAFRLPEEYRKETLIPKTKEAFFLNYEIERLKPFTSHIDPRLKKPINLELKIRKLTKERKRRKDYWLADIYYESEIGIVNAENVWEGIHAKKEHLYSDAGLILLKVDRFNWMHQIPKRRLHRTQKKLKLTTIEWIRICIIEDIKEPAENTPEARETAKLMRELNSLEALRLLDISHLKSTLRPYQELGLQWLWFLYCHGLAGLLCDEMGLGKTHQAMALLAAVTKEDRSGSYKYLVVCPTSVIYHWQDLLERFLPSLRVLSFYGTERTLDGFEKNYDLLLTSYGILRTGKENLKSLHFEVAIFDEIQIAKNHTSQTHASLSNLKANMKLGLTGTPIENRLRELKAIFDITLPNYLPGDKDFRNEFVTPIEKHRDPEKRELLSKLVKPFILRRKKAEVLLDLPEKMEEISYCDLSPEQEKLYHELAQQNASKILNDLKEKKKNIPYTHIFSLLNKLKQICDHPSLLLEDTRSYQKHESGKWNLFTELIAEARDSNQKIVVFSQYLGMLSIIENYLKKNKIGFAGIKGSTRNRKEQLKKFKEDPKCEVFVASLLAAGVGIDLSSASIVIHYDRWWNPSKEDQATDRVHRIGQSRGVQVFKLVTKNTIEEHIHTLIERKKGLIEETLGKDDSTQIKFLSREELIDALQKTLGK